jgi:TonB family protein
MKALVVFGVIVLVGCRSQSAQDRLLAMGERGRDGYGIAPSWPAVSVKIIAFDPSLDSSPALKARSERLDQAPVSFERGKVRARVIVNQDGSVNTVEVIESTSRVCTDNAIPALKTWSFFPAKRNGEAVRCVIDCEVTLFYLNE